MKIVAVTLEQIGVRYVCSQTWADFCARRPEPFPWTNDKENATQYEDDIAVELARHFREGPLDKGKPKYPNWYAMRAGFRVDNTTIIELIDV